MPKWLKKLFKKNQKYVTPKITCPNCDKQMKLDFSLTKKGINFCFLCSCGYHKIVRQDHPIQALVLSPEHDQNKINFYFKINEQNIFIKSIVPEDLLYICPPEMPTIPNFTIPNMTIKEDYE